MCSRSASQAKCNSSATAMKHHKWRNSILVFSRHWLIGHFRTSALIAVKRSQYEYPGHGRSTSQNCSEDRGTDPKPHDVDEVSGRDR